MLYFSLRRTGVNREELPPHMADTQLPADLLNFRRLLQKNLGGLFAPGRPVFIARAPGRLDLLGGATALAAMPVLHFPLSQAVIVAVQPRLDRRILIRNLNLNRERVLTVEYRLDDLLEAVAQPDWKMLRGLSAAAEKSWTGSVLAALALLYPLLQDKSCGLGVNIAIESALPAGAGLGYSGALLTALLLALQEAYALPSGKADLAEWAFRIEQEIMRRKCGPPDFQTFLFGKEGQFALLQGEPAEIKSFLPLPPNLQLLAIDTGVRRTAEWQKLNETCVSLLIGRTLLREALAGQDSLRPAAEDPASVPEELWQKVLKKMVPYRCSGAEFLRNHPGPWEGEEEVDPEKRYMPRTMLEFAIEEAGRVHAFMRLMQEGGSNPDEVHCREAGALLAASHDHFSRISGMVSEDANWLVEASERMIGEAGIYGARAMPWGAAGAVVVLCKSGKTDHVQNLISRLKSQFGKSPLLLTDSSSGAKTFGAVTAHFTN